MKKTILLFFAIAGIISCTENDTLSNNHNQADSGIVKPNDPQDKSLSDLIIGEWQLESIHFEPVRDLATECQKKSTLKFNQDGTFTGVSYITDTGKPCYEEDENSTWKNNNGETNYTIDGYIVEITFSKNNTNAAIRVTKDNPDYDGLFKGSLDSDQIITYKRK